MMMMIMMMNHRISMILLTLVASLGHQQQFVLANSAFNVGFLSGLGPNGPNQGGFLSSSFGNTMDLAQGIPNLLNSAVQQVTKPLDGVVGSLLNPVGSTLSSLTGLTGKIGAGLSLDNIPQLAAASSVGRTANSASVMNSLPTEMVGGLTSGLAAATGLGSLTNVASAASQHMANPARILGALTAGDAPAAITGAARARNALSGAGRTAGAISAAGRAAGAMSAVNQAAGTLSAVNQAAGTLSAVNQAAGTLSAVNQAAGAMAAANHAAGAVGAGSTSSAMINRAAAAAAASGVVSGAAGSAMDNLHSQAMVNPMERQEAAMAAMSTYGSQQDGAAMNSMMSRISGSTNSVHSNMQNSMAAATAGSTVNNHLNSMATSHMSNLANNQINTLANSQVNHLVGGQMSTLANSQMTNLVGSQMNNLVGSQMNSLTGNQINSLANSQVSSLAGSQVNNLAGNQINEIANSQMSNLANSQMSNLANSQISGLAGNQMNSLANGQMNGLVSDHMNNLANSHLKNQLNNIENTVQYQTHMHQRRQALMTDESSLREAGNSIAAQSELTNGGIGGSTATALKAATAQSAAGLDVASHHAAGAAAAAAAVAATAGSPVATGANLGLGQSLRSMGPMAGMEMRAAESAGASGPMGALGYPGVAMGPEMALGSHSQMLNGAALDIPQMSNYYSAGFGGHEAATAAALGTMGQVGPAAAAAVDATSQQLVAHNEMMAGAAIPPNQLVHGLAHQPGLVINRAIAGGAIDSTARSLGASQALEVAAAPLAAAGNGARLALTSGALAAEPALVEPLIENALSPVRQNLAASAHANAEAEAAIAGNDMVAHGLENSRSASLATNAYRQAKLASARDRVNIAGTVQNSARISDAAIATHDAATKAEDSLLGSELAVDSAATVLDSDAAYIPPVTSSMLRSLPYGRLGLRNILPKPLTYPSVLLPDVWLNGLPVNYKNVPLRMMPYGVGAEGLAGAQNMASIYGVDREGGVAGVTGGLVGPVGGPVGSATATGMVAAANSGLFLEGQPIMSNNGIYLNGLLVDPKYAYLKNINNNIEGSSVMPILANGQLEAQDEVAMANILTAQQQLGPGMLGTYNGYGRMNTVPMLTGSVSDANLAPTTTVGTTYPIGSALVIEPRDSYFQDYIDNASSRQNFDERQQ